MPSPASKPGNRPKPEILSLAPDESERRMPGSTHLMNHKAPARFPGPKWT